MTWGKATPVIVISVIFDLMRIFFGMFWFFGPAFATVYCTSKLGEWVGSLWGLTAAACVAAGGITGTLGLPITIAFGTIMSMMAGFLGWMTVGLILIISNARIFKENADHALLSMASLLVSAIPIIGMAPALTGSTWKMYSTQIKKDGEKLRQYKSEQAVATAEKRQQQQAVATEFMQNQAMQQQAANDEQYTNEEIPEEGRKAA